MTASVIDDLIDFSDFWSDPSGEKRQNQAEAEKRKRQRKAQDQLELSYADSSFLSTNDPLDPNFDQESLPATKLHMPPSKPKRNVRRAGGQPRRAKQMPRDPFAGVSTNPFAKTPLQRWPDGTSTRTIAVRVEESVNLAFASGNDLSSFAALPRTTSPIYAAPTYTSNAYPLASWGSATNFADNSSLSASFDRYRIASWGVELKYVGRSDAASGYVTVSTLTDDQGLSNVVSPTMSCLHRDEFVVEPGMCIRWIGAPLGSAAHKFIPYAQTSGETQYSWTFPLFFIEGTNSDCAFRARVVYQLECLPVENTVMTYLTDHAGHITQRDAGKGSTVSVFDGIAEGVSAGLRNASQAAIQVSAQALYNRIMSSRSGAYRISNS